MKTSHVFTLAAISLSLTLCACDKGDKESGPIAVPPSSSIPKPPKAEGGEAKVNPPPPESKEPTQDMNKPAAVPGAPTGAEEPNFEKFSQVDMINNALTLYATKQRQSSSMAQMAAAAKSNGTKKDAHGNYPDYSKKAAGSGGVTSLDQLVTAGVLKSIPAPPEGKKYVLDVKAQTVRLENK